MHQFAWFTDEITDASRIYLPAVSSAAFYGRGIFTTVAVYNSKPFEWKRHWRRLNADAERVGVDLKDFTEAKVESSLLETINQNSVQNGRARLTFFDESASGIWKIPGERETKLLITTADFRNVSDEIRLTVSPFPVNSKSPLAGVKSCNYLENLLVLEEAGRRGFNEAIRLNETGKVVSAAMANVFWAEAGKIFTPPLSTGALEGTTRGFVMENFDVIEKYVLPEELKNADAVFLTSAGIGISAAESVDKRKFKRSDIFIKVKNFFDDFRAKSA